MAGYLYIGLSLSPSKIVKIRLSDFTRESVLTLSSGNNNITCMAIDTNAGFLYAGCNLIPGRVVKIRLSDFTEVATLISSLGGRNYYYKDLVIDNVNGFLYAQSGSTSFPTVKIRLSDFTEIDSLIWSSGGADPSMGMIDINRGFAYFGTGASYIGRVNLSDFTSNSYLGFGNISQSSCIDTVNNKGYWGINAAPGRIIRVSLCNIPSDVPSLDSTLILPSGDGTVRSQVIDVNGGFIYGGTYDSPAKVIKIRLSDFTKNDSMTFDTGENLSTFGAAIDTVNGYAYFAVLTSPAKIMKIRLSDFTRESTLTLNSGETTANSMEIDPILFIPGQRGGGGGSGGGASGRHLKRRFFSGRSFGR